MELSEFRTSAVQRWLEGDDAHLVELILSNSLNSVERKFVAQIVKGDAPKRSRGRKRSSIKPIRAALIRFWIWDVDKNNATAVENDIERILNVSNTMARDYLKQIDFPKTKGQFAAKLLFQMEEAQRLALVSGQDGDLLREIRARDLKPISEK